MRSSCCSYDENSVGNESTKEQRYNGLGSVLSGNLDRERRVFEDFFQPKVFANALRILLLLTPQNMVSPVDIKGEIRNIRAQFS